MGEKGLAGVAPTIVVNIDAVVETPKPEPQVRRRPRRWHPEHVSSRKASPYKSTGAKLQLFRQ
jgi:hypothetical protein